MAWKTIDRESGSRNLAVGGAVVLTHAPTISQLGLPTRIKLSIAGLDAGAQTLVILYAQGAILCGQPASIDVPASFTTYKTDVLLPSLDGTSATVQISSNNPSDTAVTITAELAVDTAAVEPEELRSIARINGPGLVALTGSATGYAAIVGSDLIPGRADVEPRLTLVEDAWLTMCPVDRAVTYYFDAANGNDLNDGLTEATPKQTIAEINLRAAAGVTLRCRGKWKTNVTAQIPAGCTITNWKGHAWPIFDGQRLTIAANVAAWASGGGVWTTTLANAASLHPEPWVYWRNLSICPDAAAVAATANSYHINIVTGVITLNYPTNPNLINWELNHTADFGEIASGIQLNGHGARAHRVICIKNGFGPYGAGTNQSWGIRCVQTDEAVACVTDFICEGHYLHNIGHLVSGGAGGRSLFKNGSIGGCFKDETNEAATMFVDYARDGGQECIVDNVHAMSGRLPQSAKVTAESYIRFLYSHTFNDTFRASMCASIRCSISDQGQVPVRDFGSWGNGVGDTADHNTLRTFHIVPMVLVPQVNNTAPIQSRNVYMGGVIRIKPNYNASLGVNNFIVNGHAFAVTFEMDWSGINTQFSFNIYGVTANTPALSSAPKFINCHWHMKNASSGGSRQHAILRIGEGVAVNLATKAINTLFTTDNNGADYRLSIGNVNSTSGVFKNNAIGPGWTNHLTAEHGWSNWLYTVLLTDTVPLFVSDPRLQGAGSPDGAICEIDGYGRQLARPGTHIGPWGELAEKVNTSRQALLPVESARLESLALALDTVQITLSAPAVVALKPASPRTLVVFATCKTANGVLIDPVDNELTFDVSNLEDAGSVPTAPASFTRDALGSYSIEIELEHDMPVPTTLAFVATGIFNGALSSASSNLSVTPRQPVTIKVS